MTTCSLAFLLFLSGTVFAFQLAPVRWLRQLVLASASAGFLVSMVPNQRSWVWFTVTLAGTYLALVLVRVRKSGPVVALAITLIVLLYLYLKRFTLFADFIPVSHNWDLRLHPVELVGLSYMIFKFIHMLVDQWQGQLAPCSLWSYLNYQLSFFTLTAGPIQRYNDFARYWNEMDLESSARHDSLLCCIRLLTGLIKIGVLGAYTQSVLHSATYTHASITLTEALTRFYLFPINLYFNFSGYTDAVIGAAGLLGFRLPENFNRPWLARNVLDFWDRWHISLTHWIRDYIFMASYKVAATKFPRGARYWSYALLFIALFIAGVWHGATDGFVIFGALNGLGAAATRAYGDVLRARLGRHGLQSYLKSRSVRVIAIAATLHYVCLCQLFFSSDLTSAMTTLRAAGDAVLHLPATLSVCSWQSSALVVGTAIGLLVVLWKSDAVGAILERLSIWIAGSTGRLCVVLCVQCMLVGGMFFVDWTFEKEPPPVVYGGF
jgi:alginate O-acetyltransferase complex protein AlgI